MTLVVAIGCGRPPPPPVVRVAVAQAPEALDPRFTTSATGMRMSQLVAPPLCVVGDDGRCRLVLAESIEVMGPLLVEAKLRSDLRFPDGAGVTAADVAFSFSSVLDPATGSPHRPRLHALERVEVVDERTVRFHLKEPQSPFVVDVIAAIGILQEKTTKTCRDVAACRFRPQGAGAYQVKGVDVDRFSFEKRSAKADLELRVQKDSTARLLALAAGDVDVLAGDVAPWDLERLQEDASVLARPGLGFSYLGVNARRFDDDTRNAILRAVDVDALLLGRLRGHGARASGLLPPGHWAKDPQLAPVGRDVEKARSLLHGKRVHATLLTTPDRLRRSVALALQQQLAEAGVDVDVVVRDWSVVYEELKAGRFDLVLAKWVPVAEPDLLTTVFHSRSIPEKDKPGGNRAAFVDAEVDGWLDAARATFDEGERARLYGLVEHRVQDRAALVPLWFDEEVMVAGPRVHGLSPWRTGSLLPLADVELR